MKTKVLAVLLVFGAILTTSAMLYAADSSVDTQHLTSEMITKLGIDTDSEVYKKYVSLVNQLMEIYDFDTATFGLLIIDDYREFMEGEKSLFDWNMISK